MIYGDAWHVGQDGARISPYPVEPFDPENLARRCFICQPAAFMRREVFAEAGMLDVNLHYAMDYDLWIRMAKLHSKKRHPMKKIDAFLATSRLHPSSKTVGQMGPSLLATIQYTAKRHYGYVRFNWIDGYGQPECGIVFRTIAASLILEKFSFSCEPSLASCHVDRPGTSLTRDLRLRYQCIL